MAIYEAELKPELLKGAESPEIKAKDMAERLGKFITGDVDRFYAYFLLEDIASQQTERDFIDNIGLDPDFLIPTKRPSIILEKDGTSLYRWVHFVDDQPFDAYYQACRDGEVPILFSEWAE